MSIHARVSGVWRTITDPKVRASGAWRDLAEGWVRVSGVWQQFYTGVTYQAPDVTINSTDSEGFIVDGRLMYDSDGGVRKLQESGGSQSIQSIAEWSSAHPNETDGASWSVRVTHQTGDDTYSAGDSLGTWLALSTNRQWIFAGPSSGPDTELGTYSVDISNDGGSTVHDSGTLIVSLENSGP